MAKKVILKDDNVEIMPITRGELVLDSSGQLAFHSSQFLATQSLPGLMSGEDKTKLDSLEKVTVEDKKVEQVNTTTDNSYRILFSNSADDTTKTEGTRKSAKLLFNPSTGALTATALIGKLDWSNLNGVPEAFTPAQHIHNTSEITALTSYSKASSASDLVTTDTLNVALGKLEYKADAAYDFYKSVTGTDNDEIINKWEEIVDFVDSVKEGSDIIDEFVTRKTGQTITGVKTFSTLLKFTVDLGTSPFTVTSTTKVDNLNADLLDGKHATDFMQYSSGGKYVQANLINSELWSLAGGNGYIEYYDSGTWFNSQWGKVTAHYGFEGSLSGNATSATKLQTARTIWGLSFDGTGNVDGILKMNVDVTAASVASSALQINNTGTYAGPRLINAYSPNLPVSSSAANGVHLMFGVTEASYNAAYMKFWYAGAGSTNNAIRFGFHTSDNLMSIIANGNVGIGTTSPSYLLHVNGSVYGDHYYGNAITLYTRGSGTYTRAWITAKDSAGDFIIEAPLTTDSASGTRAPITLTWRGGYPSMGGLKITGYSEAVLGGNKIWHAGNDGSGSGLDADTVDSLHASDFVRAYGTYGTSYSYNSDWGLSIVTFDPVVSGTYPENNPNITILNLGNNYARRKQLAFTYSNNNIYYRRRTDSSWSGWVRLAIAGESYTKTEADNRFVNYTGDTMTGALTIGQKVSARKATWLKLVTPGHTGSDAWCIMVDDTTDYSIIQFGYTASAPIFHFRTDGALIATHFYESSDAILKTNILDIVKADKIPTIRQFDWKSDGSRSYGLIAQELEEMGYSELVDSSGDHKTVKYSAALSLIVGKLQVKIKELEKEIEILKKKN